VRGEQDAAWLKTSSREQKEKEKDPRKKGISHIKNGAEQPRARRGGVD